MHFRVFPFGLHKAPPTFQRLMGAILNDVGEFAAAYLDDVVIFSSSWQDHLRHLQAVFQRIKDAGLTINPAKCHLVKTETDYLGYVLGNGKIETQVQKIRAIQACPRPMTKKQIKSFLGLVSWYRKFIPHFSIFNKKDKSEGSAVVSTCRKGVWGVETNIERTTDSAKPWFWDSFCSSDWCIGCRGRSCFDAWGKQKKTPSGVSKS